MRRMTLPTRRRLASQTGVNACLFRLLLVVSEDTFDRRGSGRNRSFDVFRADALRGVAECGANRACAAPYPELVVDVLEVRSDSRRRDEEPAADLAVRQTLCNQGEHVELALRQGRQVRPALPPRAQAGEVRPEEREERTIAFVEVGAGPSLELEVARVAARRRQPQLQLVFAAQRPHHGQVEPALLETRARDDVADPQRL